VLFLLEIARQESGPVRDGAAAGLALLGGDDVRALVRQARDAEVGDRRETFDRILKAI
jgi:hypothetical protein